MSTTLDIKSLQTVLSGRTVKTLPDDISIASFGDKKVILKSGSLNAKLDMTFI